MKMKNRSSPGYPAGNVNALAPVFFNVQFLMRILKITNGDCKGIRGIKSYRGRFVIFDCLIKTASSMAMFSKILQL